MVPRIPYPLKMTIYIFINITINIIYNILGNWGIGEPYNTNVLNKEKPSFAYYHVRVLQGFFDSSPRFPY